MTTEQLALFQDAPTAPPARVVGPVALPAPSYGPAFYVGGWKVWRVEGWPFGGGQMHGWQACKPADVVPVPTHGGYSPRVLRAWLAGLSPRLRPDDLPTDLYARGFERDVRPGYTHWIHWPAGSYSACLDSLERNIAACRKMKTQPEFLAQYRAEQAAMLKAKKDKRTRRAA
jgi:hypothetical protein